MSEHKCSTDSCGSGCGTDQDFDRILAEQEIKNTLSKIKHKVSILSGKGGVGKSTVCAALASALAHDGHQVGILDVDLHGPSIPGMFGVVETKPDMSDNGKMCPVKAGENLSIMSVGFLLKSRNDALIWRGPLKIGVIEQFIKDVEWGELDYLLVDCPPGTGDEPLTVLQTMEDSDGSILITTPQEVSVDDVRKSVTFCRKLNNRILGVIENMSYLECPHCDKEIKIFKGNGGEQIAKEANSTLMAKLPIMPSVVESADNGTIINNKDSLEKFRKVADELYAAIEEKKQAEKRVLPKKEGKKVIAVPVNEDKTLAGHFGHCKMFNFYEVDIVKKEIEDILAVTPPEHEPGVIPAWLSDKGADVVITGGIGEKAVSIFNKRGIEVVSGAKSMKAEQLIEDYMNDKLEVTGNTCSH